MENKWERVAEDNPNRCQCIIATRGQCLNKAVEGSEYCPAHGGNRAVETKRKEQRRMYDIERFKAKMGQFADHPKLKSLTEEIAVLRMMLEATLKQCNDEFELALKSNVVSKMISDINTLVNSCHKLDLQLNRMLDENQAIQFVQEIVEIMARHITDSVVREAIASEVLDALERIKGEQS